VAGRSDAGGTVHVSADVALVDEKWRPRVQADAHLDRARRERLGHLARSCKRARRRREGEEEGIPLGVHRDPVVTGAGLANHPPVLGERLRVPLGAELVQQPRRPLDVGEEEGNGAGGEVGPHRGIMSQSNGLRHRRPIGCETTPPPSRSPRSASPTGPSSVRVTRSAH
jgi:hypothetical protein